MHYSKHLRKSIWNLCGGFSFILLFGCASGLDIKRAENYSISAPKQWNRYEGGESDLAYHLKSGSFVTLTSSCERYSDRPLPLLTKHLLIGTREINYTNQEEVEVGGRKGLYSSVMAKVEGEPVWLELFVITKDKCIFDFTLSKSKAIPEGEISEFKNFIRSLNFGKDD